MDAPRNSALVSVVEKQRTCHAVACARRTKARKDCRIWRRPCRTRQAEDRSDRDASADQLHARDETADKRPSGVAAYTVLLRERPFDAKKFFAHVSA
jgi:hypothetical protein